jgi:3-oxoacyl-[acyl-carrier protein] reductase
MSKLSRKVAVVTGASKGIGAGIARALAAEGAAVVVNYASDRAGAEKVVGDIVSRDQKAVAVQADVSRAADVRRLFQETKKAFGSVDVLVNNAGIYRFDPLEGVTEAEFHRQFNTNVLGTMLAVQEALKLFGPEGGSVINVSSVISEIGMPGGLVYAATKAAIDSVTRTLAAELAPRKVRVNTIAPGAVETEGTHAAGIIGSDFEKQAVARTLLGRIGQPDDIARVVVFLASDDSRWITGERLKVSGGFH